MQGDGTSSLLWGGGVRLFASDGLRARRSDALGFRLHASPRHFLKAADINKVSLGGVFCCQDASVAATHGSVTSNVSLYFLFPTSAATRGGGVYTSALDRMYSC